VGWYAYDNDKGEFLVYFRGDKNIGAVTRNPQPCNGKMKFIWALASMEFGGEADTMEKAQEDMLFAMKFVSVQ
jgi:hypothetical protein